MTQAVFKKKIAFPQYSNFQTRLDSYNRKHPYSVIYDFKKVFADAGFFHTGKDDETICYYCGGGLKDWDDADDPWEEHARWFRKCPFLIVIKGQSFVDNHCNRKSCNPIKTITNNIENPEEYKIDKPEKEPNIVTECIVCLSSERNILFLPCNHCCTCTTCGLSVDNCVYCRAPIKSVMKIFLV